MPLCSCEMEIAVLIGHSGLLLYMDQVSEDPGSHDGSTTAVQHQQNTHTHTHKDFTPNRGHPVNTLCLVMLPGLKVDGTDTSRTAEKYLFHLVFPERRKMSKQNPQPLLNAFNSSLPRMTI